MQTQQWLWNVWSFSILQECFLGFVFQYTMLKKKIQNYDKLFVDSNMFQIIRYAENVCHDRKFFTKKRQ